MRGFGGFVGRDGALALALGLMLGAGPAGAQTPPPAVPVAAEPSSTEQLKAAIEEIKQRLAKQKAAEGQPSATAGLTDELKAASLRLQNLTQAMETLRAERDQLRADLATAHGQLDQMSQELVAGQRQLREQASQHEAGLAAADAAKAKLTGDLAAAEKQAGELRARLEATDQARAKAETALAAAEAALRQTAKGADAQLAEAKAALDKSRQDLATAETRATAGEAEIETLQGQLADAVNAAGAKEQEAARLTTALAQEKAARAGAEQALADAKAAAARLDNDYQTARAEADRQAKATSDALTAELAKARARASDLEAQATTLQTAAGSSVAEVRGLGEQLLQALAQNQDLTTGLAEMRVTKEVLDKELASARRDAASASKEAGDLRAELAKARQGLIGLAAPESTGDATAAATATAPSAGGDQLASLQLTVTDPAPTAAAEPALPATVLAVVRDLNGSVNADGWVMVVPAGLDFRPGTSDLTPSGVAALGKVAGLIQALPAGRIRIVGHTDSDGGADDNLRLSLQRAQSVRDQLVGEYRLAPQVIQTEGYGESRPITSNDTAEGRKANRRVEIYLHP
jgi:outer membrane protein OmpA-like peptidoglycan-associated protein